MSKTLGLIAAVLFVAAAARADNPPATQAPAPPASPAAPAPAQGQAPATAQAPTPAEAPPAQVPAVTAPATPSPIPAPAHKEPHCGLQPIHQHMVAAEREIKKSPAYGHTHRHYKLALQLLHLSMKHLNHGCAMYTRDQHKKGAGAKHKK